MARRNVGEIAFRPWRKSDEAKQYRSLWLNQALLKMGRGDETPLTSDVSADVCIVGGGYTGLWTALRLREAEPGLKIILLEADICGSGASGRNGGHISGLWSRLPTLVRLLGPEDATELLFESAKVTDDIRSACDAYEIDCELSDCEGAWVASTEAESDSWAMAVEAARTLGIPSPWREMTADEIKVKFAGSPIYGGLWVRDSMRVQPAMLARGLYQACLRENIEIVEQTPVRRIERPASGKVIVRSERGKVSADKVVLAANAWMAHLPEFRRWVMIVSSDMVATDPIPELLRERGMSDFPTTNNSRMMINYGGVSSSGNVYLGRGGGTLSFDARVTDSFDYSPDQSQEVRTDFRYLFPQLANVPIRHAWSGAVDRTPAGLPKFGSFANDDRLEYAIGYTGHGISAAAEAGHILTSRVLGIDDAWADLGDLYGRVHKVKDFPPEPVRFLGGQLVRRAVFNKEIAEREGRRPHRLAVKLSTLAPATIIDGD